MLALAEIHDVEVRSNDDQDVGEFHREAIKARIVWDSAALQNEEPQPSEGDHEQVEYGDGGCS